MITWLQRFFERHKVFVVIAFGVVIIAFIFVINESGGLGGRPEPAAEMFGVDINSPRVREAERENVMTLLQLTGIPREMVNFGQVDEFWERRLGLTYLADRLGLPGPTRDQMWEMITSFPIFQDAEGNFSEQAYDDFLDEIQASPSMTQSQFVRALVTQFRGDLVEGILYSNAYVQPFHRERFLEDNFSTWDGLLGTLNYGGFQPEIEIEEESLEAFYRINASRYETPTRVSGQVILLRGSGDPTEIEVTDDQVRAYFDRNAPRYGLGPDEDAELVFEMSRDRVVSDLQASIHRNQLADRTNQLTLKLSEKSAAPDSEKLAALVTEHGAELIPTGRLSRGETIEGLELTAEQVAPLFRMDQGRGRFLTPPQEYNGGYYLLIFQERIEPTLPPIAERREQVEKDYREDVRRRLFREHGDDLAQQLRELVDAGGDFREVAERLGFTVSDFEEVGLNTDSSGFPRSELLRRSLLGLGRHQISRFLPDARNGYVVKVTERQVPNREELGFQADIMAMQLDRMYQIISQAAYEDFVDANKPPIRRL